MTKENKRLVVIDSNSVIHRAFHALPPLTTKKGELVNAIYGFLLVFFRVLKDFQPDYVAATFDLPSPTFRHEKFEGYKAKRPKTPEELFNQIPKVKEVLEGLNIPVFEKQGFEADDIIGTIAKIAPKIQIAPSVETIIVSGDLDVLQLVNKNTKVFILRKGIKDAVSYDKGAVKNRYEGLTPEQLTDFRGLKGDPSDNIPGVTGIGEKTAIQLLQQFGSLENLYKEIEEKTEKSKIIKPAVKKKLIDYKEQAFFSRELGTINTSVPIDFNLEECRLGRYDKEKAVDTLKKFEFYSLISKLP